MGEMMAEEILVPTKGLNGIEEIIPHLEHIANPAMSVILLVPYRTELLRSLLHQWIPAESREEDLPQGIETTEGLSLEPQNRLADQNSAPARESLMKFDPRNVSLYYLGSNGVEHDVPKRKMAMELIGLERKLTAILSADVVGYSRLMGEDEAGTIHTLTAYREVMTTLIQQHRGRVVDAPGDNLLAEFASAVGAVESALAIQQELKTRNAELPADRQMVYRIGINVGEVVVEGERIYGDGVNIASRLESLAESGGICLSGNAFELVRDKLAVGFKNLGDRRVKNINRPISAYSVLTDPDFVGKVKNAPAKGFARWKWPAVTTTVMFILIAASIGVWWP